MINDRLLRMQKMAERFSHNGSVDKITLRKINALTQSMELEETPMLVIAKKTVP